MNKDPIKCAYCGKFISYSDLEDGKASNNFGVKSNFDTVDPGEDRYFVCKKCTCNYGVSETSKEAIEAWNTRVNNEKYEKLLAFVKDLASEDMYDRYENENDVKWVANEVLKEIGE